MEKSRMKVSVFSVAIISILLLAFGATHAASSAIYTSPLNITLNSSTSLIHTSVLVFGNQSLSVFPSSPSSDIFFSVSKFNVTPSTGYNFSFFVNASSPINTSLTFKTNTSAAYVLPVRVKSNAIATNQTYLINVVGTVASYHSVTISIEDTKTSTLVTQGELIVQYDGNSTAQALSQPFMSLSFGNLYGQVIIEYVTPSGSVGAYEIINTANTVANRAPLSVSCNLRPIVIAGINTTAIPTYSVQPMQNITCTLLDNTDNTFPEGVASYILMNGQEYDPQPSNAMGQVTFPYPQGGWPVGSLVFKTASSSYSLGDALISVVPYPNPLTVDFNGIATNQTTLQGNIVEIIPNVQQEISIHFPNGTVSTYNTSSPIKVEAVGDIKLTASSPMYSAFSELIDLTPVPLTLTTSNQTSIYTFRTYKFLLVKDNSVYNYTGIAHIGSTTLTFSNGEAVGYLNSTNTTVVIPGGGYVVSPAVSVGLDPVIIILPPTVYTHRIYSFALVSNGTAVPYTGSLQMVQNNKTTMVPVTDGQGVIGFNSTAPVTISPLGSAAISPFMQKIDPVNASPFYFQFWFIGLVVLGIIAFVEGPGIYRRIKNQEYYGDAEFQLN